MINHIKIINNFLSKSEIDILMLECLNPNTKWQDRDESVKVEIANSNSHDVIKGIKNKVNSFFDNTFYIQIIRHLNKTTTRTTWHKHYDGEYPGIEYGVIIYLNDDFEGGELFYPNLNYLYQPKAGDIIIHPATEEYTHEVYPVISGDRYTLTTFVRRA
jgi:hypothetical protein